MAKHSIPRHSTRWVAYVKYSSVIFDPVGDSCAGSVGLLSQARPGVCFEPLSHETSPLPSSNTTGRSNDTHSRTLLPQGGRRMNHRSAFGAVSRLIGAIIDGQAWQMDSLGLWEHT